MSIPGKILVALIVALLTAFITTQVSSTNALLGTFYPCAVAAVVAVLLSHRALPMPSGIAAADSPQAAPAARRNNSSKASPSNRETAKRTDRKPSAKASKTATGSLEDGSVKWFNGTKGFGFIVRANGDEIFVHHRSIKGEGRRSLRDGAPVRFRVVDTDKGPQAEDVESIEA